MSSCTSLIDFPIGILTLAATPAAEDGATAPASEPLADGKQEPPHYITAQLGNNLQTMMTLLDSERVNCYHMEKLLWLIVISVVIAGVFVSINNITFLLV